MWVIQNWEPDSEPYMSLHLVRIGYIYHISSQPNLLNQESSHETGQDKVKS